METERWMLREAIPMIGVKWAIPDDFLTENHFRRVVMSGIVWNSSPGYPYKRIAGDNAGFFGAVNGIPNPDRMRLIWQMVQDRLVNRDCDPIYLFIKQEPLPARKIDRKRLISSVSVIDQIIDHMLFDGFNDAVVANAADGAIKVGWTPHSGGWKLMPRKGHSIDKSTWDWTMMPWLINLCLRVRELTCLPSPHFDLWLELATWRYGCLFNNPLFVEPGGKLFRQRRPGVMKSGSVVTIIDNSIAQLLLHLRVLDILELDNDGWFWAMGDDTRQKFIANLKRYLEVLSRFCRVRSVTEECEFAGFRFSPGKLEPLYQAKHAYILLHADPKVELDLVQAYSLLYHRSDHRDAVRKLVSHFGDPPPLIVLDEIVDGD